MEGGVAPAPDMLACDERCHVTGRIFHQFIPARHHSRGRFSHSPLVAQLEAHRIELQCAVCEREHGSEFPSLTRFLSMF